MYVFTNTAHQSTQVDNSYAVITVSAGFRYRIQSHWCLICNATLLSSWGELTGRNVWSPSLSSEDAAVQHLLASHKSQMFKTKMKTKALSSRTKTR